MAAQDAGEPPPQADYAQGLDAGVLLAPTYVADVHAIARDSRDRHSPEFASLRSTLLGELGVSEA